MKTIRFSFLVKGRRFFVVFPTEGNPEGVRTGTPTHPNNGVKLLLNTSGPGEHEESNLVIFGAEVVEATAPFDRFPKAGVVEIRDQGGEVIGACVVQLPGDAKRFTLSEGQREGQPCTNVHLIKDGGEHTNNILSVGFSVVSKESGA